MPPVLDAPVYADRFFDDASSKSALVFKSFEALFELRTNHRQSDDQRFGEILDRVALGEITEDDYKLLSSRANDNLSQDEIKSFKNAIHSYPTNELVDKRNNDVLRLETNHHI